MAKTNKYDSQHWRNQAAYERQVDAIYRAAAKEAAALGVSVKDFNPDRLFSFSDYPTTRKKIEKLLSDLQTGIMAVIVNGIRSEWTLANNKNNELARQVFGDNVGKLTKEQERRYFSTNGAARDAFIKRKTDGLGLSDRVWKYTNQFKDEIELGLDLGIRSGRSADELSRDLRSYLQHPDKLFRRVRNEHGLLVLSQRAKAYHPGRGVYRSSYKNARRLAATETNIAYMTADYERWQQLDFVVGIEIKLSNNHPVPDICDDLKGRYPKDFKFTGWHPLCRCHVVSILKTEEELAADARRILAGEEPAADSANTVTGVPQAFKDWLKENKERAKRSHTIPYFIKDNGKYIPKDWVDGIGSMAKGRSKGIITDVREAIIKVKDPTFITEKEVRAMIEKYAETEPGDFYGGLKGVKISSAKGAMMANERLYYNKTGAYAKESGNTIKIYKTDHHVIDPNGNSVVFNPLHEIKGAMRAIAAKTPLTFNQEYAIESLWHEIRHAGAVGWEDIRKQTDDLVAAMECINQFCARRSYGKLLRTIGGSVSHKKEIIKSGYGYNRSVRHFDEMLSSMNISSSEAYAHFSKMIMVEPYENIFGKIVDFLVEKGTTKQKAEMLVKTLRHSDDMFSKILTGV